MRFFMKEFWLKVSEKINLYICCFVFFCVLFTAWLTFVPFYSSGKNSNTIENSQVCEQVEETKVESEAVDEEPAVKFQGEIKNASIDVNVKPEKNKIKKNIKVDICNLKFIGFEIFAITCIICLTIIILKIDAGLRFEKLEKINSINSETLKIDELTEEQVEEDCEKNTKKTVKKNLLSDVLKKYFETIMEI